MISIAFFCFMFQFYVFFELFDINGNVVITLLAQINGSDVSTVLIEILPLFIIAPAGIDINAPLGSPIITSPADLSLDTNLLYPTRTFEPSELVISRDYTGLQSSY